MHLQINLLAEHLDPLHCLAQWHRVLNAEGHSSHAAESMFIGRVRATDAEGQPLAALELEHYPGMTERQLQELAHACCQRHGVSRCLIQHRIGRVLPGDAIVLVVIGADRRGQARRSVLETGMAARWRQQLAERQHTAVSAGGLAQKIGTRNS
jgi:molybdopterin synthase catalytic subunit